MPQFSTTSASLARRLRHGVGLAVWWCAWSTAAALCADEVGRFPDSPPLPATAPPSSEPIVRAIDPFLSPAPTTSEPLSSQNFATPPTWPGQSDVLPQPHGPAQKFPYSGDACRHCGGRHSPFSFVPDPHSCSCGLHFNHSDPDDPARHIGMGDPLYGTSWLNRPCFIGGMFGAMVADDPISGLAELQDDGILSLHIGGDFDHYWGGEVRLAGGDFQLYDSPSDSSDGIYFADMRLLYYPWGDARWRPYYGFGFGTQRHDFTDNFDRDFNTMLLHFPLGIGVKYLCHPSCAVRLEATHNISFGGGGLDAMDHFTLTGGFEYHFGGRRKSYFPYSPSVH
jgi:hypothetical protein